MKKERFSIFFSLILLLVSFGVGGCGPADTTHITTATGGDDTIIDTTPPTTPTGLTATVISSSQINLSWNPSSDNVAVVGYIVRNDGEVIAALGTTGYSDSGLEANTEYCYSVAAYDAASNQSEYAGPVCVTTLPEVVTGEWKLPFGYNGYSVVSDADGNAYIGGGYDIDGNPFVGRINADGTVAWVVSTPGTGGVDQGNGIAISLDGENVYFKFFFDIFSQTSSGYREFVRKYDSKTGTLVWSHQLSTVCGTNGPIGSIHALPNGDILAAGRNCFITLADDGASAREVFVSPNLPPSADVSVSTDGKAVFTVGSELTVNGSVVAVKKYNTDNGAVVWERTWRRPLSPDTESQYNIYWDGESVCVSPSGVVFVGTAGEYYTGSAFVHLPADIVRWDTDGNLLGSTDYGELPIGTASAATCGGSMAYFSAGTNGTGGLYSIGESGDVSLLNNIRGGSVSTDSIFVQGDLSIVYEVLDNVVLRFDSQTGDQILP